MQSASASQDLSASIRDHHRYMDVRVCFAFPNSDEQTRRINVAWQNAYGRRRSIGWPISASQCPLSVWPLIIFLRLVFPIISPSHNIPVNALSVHGTCRQNERGKNWRPMSIPERTERPHNRTYQKERHDLLLWTWRLRCITIEHSGVYKPRRGWPYLVYLVYMVLLL